ncbi:MULTISPECIES: hypothetical protein [Nocardiopsis]|uniref:MmyB-like transcription regulator ligand binding domain-containing protein n=1 Tax=Nocardiopsis sinuspersici TaxID=501010 RepID=A0A1V3BZZ6_9ACTN|nr:MULTISPECIES: hypothetical protein [Nocardiopsis]OOC53973.1 hypothetical protein NOSIN_09280 [Nocardiopsis sinuspersici]
MGEAGSALVPGAVPPAYRGVERLVHPEVGELRPAHEVLDAETRQSVVYPPADEATGVVLGRLERRRSDTLRAMGTDE